MIPMLRSRVRSVFGILEFSFESDTELRIIYTQANGPSGLIGVSSQLPAIPRTNQPRWLCRKSTSSFRLNKPRQGDAPTAGGPWSSSLLANITAGAVGIAGPSESVTIAICRSITQPAWSVPLTQTPNAPLPDPN